MSFQRASDAIDVLYSSSDDEASQETESPPTHEEWEDFWLDDTRFLWESLCDYLDTYSIDLLQCLSFEDFVKFVYHYSVYGGARIEESGSLTTEEANCSVVRSLWSQITSYNRDYKLSLLSYLRYQEFANFVYNNS